MQKKIILQCGRRGGSVVSQRGQIRRMGVGAKSPERESRGRSGGNTYAKWLHKVSLFSSSFFATNFKNNWAALFSKILYQPKSQEVGPEATL